MKNNNNRIDKTRSSTQKVTIRLHTNSNLGRTCSSCRVSQIQSDSKKIGIHAKMSKVITKIYNSEIEDIDRFSNYIRSLEEINK